eukprot:GHVN01082891.1.p2 GENE.GHVN01082891.1~~GHVN01082891.1.p2  ORF type:complete len:123 (-),score=11.23 GHVN01082891.1:61-429(-)
MRSPRQHRTATSPRQLGTGSVDSPAHADCITVTPLYSGDWILLASDGLWDNLFEEQVTAILDQCESPQEAAEVIADLASVKSLDKTWESPWAIRWRATPTVTTLARGGHLDDIGVVVGLVRP